VTLTSARDKDVKRSVQAHRCLISLNKSFAKLIQPCLDRPGSYAGEVNVAWSTLETVVNFMYTGMCDFKQDTVIDIIQAAAEFGMERLRSKAQEYINHLGKADPAAATDTEQPKEEGELKESVDDIPIVPDIDNTERFLWLSEGYKQLLDECPIAQQMDFMPACKRCCISTHSTVPSDQSCVLHNSELEHTCLADLLLARYRVNAGPTWRLLRHLPHQSKDDESDVATSLNTTNAYQMCKEILDGLPCSYGLNCTFAQSGEELAIWNAEKSGRISRHWLLGE